MNDNKKVEEKAIEEIARVIEITEQIARYAYCGLPSPRMYAKDLYWHGYHKQREGEWIDNHNGTFTCTACGGRASKMNYCGRCGAKMKGGEG